MDCLNIAVLTEIQAGGGALCDLLYFNKADLKSHGHQMGIFVLSQIISIPQDKSRATANAGFKALGFHPFGGLPETRDDPNLQVVGLSAEHTRLKGNITLNRGDKVMLIPGYADAMGFLHRKIYAIRQDHVEHVWKTTSEFTWND